MLTKEEVLKIAKLSKLEFNEEEIEEIKKDLNNIFDYIEMIKEVDIENVEPMFNVFDNEEILREDIVLETMKKEDFLENSYDKDKDFIITPKIVD